MYKIAVLGDYDSIYGFATIGLDTFPVTDTENAAKQLHTLAANDYSVIYVTEELADRISEEIEKYAEQVLRLSYRFRECMEIQEQVWQM